jgi:octaprenyl-diphosphate synthase
MRLGGILGRATSEQEEALAEYGRNLGMAFQIVDDVLDLTATEEVLGKPVASDLREGKATYAVIHALERCTEEERRTIQHVLDSRTLDGTTPEHIVEVLTRYGSIAAANDAAARYASAARACISGFPDSEFRRALLWIPEYVVEREK